MAALYEMTKDFEELFNSYEAIDDIEFPSDGKGGYTDEDGNPIDPDAVRDNMREAWFDTLDGMEEEIKEKAEAVAVYIKNTTAEVNMLKEEEDKLKARRKAKERKAERMKKYLMDCMEGAKLNKIDMPRAVISVRNNPESVNITDEARFIEWAESTEHDSLLKYSAPEIRKSFVKPLLKDGENVPFAELTRTRSIVIK